MGLFLKSNKKKNKAVVIFDVGSGSIGAACANIPFDKEENPSIIKSLRLDIKLPENSNIGNLEKEALNTLKRTALSLVERQIGRVDEVVCVITSPWCSSETRRISISNSKSFTLSKKTLDDLIQKEIDKIIKDLDEKNEDKMTLVEKMITEVLLDEKTTTNPIGKSCQFFDLNLSYSYASKTFIDKTKEVLSEVFHSNNISFSSFPILTYLMIRNNYMGQESHLLLDIGSEVTDLSVINNGIFKQKYSFPFGKRTILKHLALNFKIEYRDALELFKLYYQKEISLDLREKTEKIFTSIEKFWSEELKLCLNSVPKNHNLPNVIFLTIDNDMKNWFFEVFKKTDFANNITLNNKFRVIILDENEMIDMCSFNEGSHDPFVMIEAVALAQKIK